MTTATADDRIYKDKIEVSLDGRQIFYLFFGGAVLVGLVFVVGVMVGRRVESRSHVDSLGGLDHARAATDPLAALDGLEGKKLSFSSALVKPEPKTEVEHQIDQLEQSRTGKPADKPIVVAKPDDKKDDKADKKVEPKADKKDEPKADKKVDDKPITRPEQAKVDKPKAEPAAKDVAKADKPKAEKQDKKKIDERPINGDVVTADDKPVDVAKREPKPVAAPDKPVEKGKFTLQLSSFQDKKEAETFLSSVKAAGYSAYLTEGEVNSKTYYRVRLGKYGTMEAANDAKADIEKSIKKSASVMRL